MLKYSTSSGLLMCCFLPSSNLTSFGNDFFNSSKDFLTFQAFFQNQPLFLPAERDQCRNVRREEEGMVQEHEVLGRGLRVFLLLRRARRLHTEELDGHSVVVEYPVIVFAGTGEADHGGVGLRLAEKANPQFLGEVSATVNLAARNP